MKRIPIVPRSKSSGELAEAQRTAKYWLAREAKKVPGKHPNKNTIALRPSRYAVSAEWAEENNV